MIKKIYISIFFIINFYLYFLNKKENHTFSPNTLCKKKLLAKLLYNYIKKWHSAIMCGTLKLSFSKKSYIKLRDKKKVT